MVCGNFSFADWKPSAHTCSLYTNLPFWWLTICWCDLGVHHLLCWRMTWQWLLLSQHWQWCIINVSTNLKPGNKIISTHVHLNFSERLSECRVQYLSLQNRSLYVNIVYLSNSYCLWLLRNDSVECGVSQFINLLSYTCTYICMHDKRAFYVVYVWGLALWEKYWRMTSRLRYYHLHMWID